MHFFFQLAHSRDSQQQFLFVTAEDRFFLINWCFLLLKEADDQLLFLFSTVTIRIKDKSSIVYN